MGFIQQLRTFFQDVSAEFKRVSWPTRQATLQSTGIVLVVTLVVALFLGLVDLGLTSAIQTIIK